MWVQPRGPGEEERVSGHVERTGVWPPLLPCCGGAGRLCELPLVCSARAGPGWTMGAGGCSHLHKAFVSDAKHSGCTWADSEGILLECN